MNNIELHQTPIPSTQPVLQPTVQQSPDSNKRTKRSFDKRYLFILLIIIGIGGGFLTALKQPMDMPTPTPSDMPIPSPISKPVVSVATESAYIELTKLVASLSATIKNMQVSDTTLSPPTIELPLGFPNN